VSDDIVNLPVRGNRLGFTGRFGEPRPGGRRHLGTDFGAQTPGVAGDDIVAATPGRLVYQGPAGNYGNVAVVERDNGDGTHSYFLDAHLADPDPSKVPSVGQDVQAGQVVGQMSNTGSSSGGKPIPVHGHFEQINTSGRLDFSHGWPLPKGPSGVTPSGVAWERVGPSFQLPNGWVAKSDNGRISVTAPPMQAARAQQDGPERPFQFPDPGERREGNQTSAPPIALPANASPSFDDRFSAIYNSPSAGAGNFAGQSIPFAPRPVGVLGPQDESAFLNPAPMNPGAADPFAAGTQFIPGSASSSRPLYPTGSFVARQNAPNSPALQMNRRSDIRDGVTPTLAQAPSPSALALASSDVNAPASLFTRLLSAGPDALRAADDMPSPPLQPDATPDAADDGPTRFLVGRTYDPSRGSPLAAPPAPSQSSPVPPI
jgi:murein DD-endopeptidase MepM/ murein hydrolase activator NlpD